MIVVLLRGVLHVGHTGKHRNERFDHNGRLVDFWQERGTEPEEFCGCCNPTNLALFPNGYVATTEKGLLRLKVYDASGKRLACTYVGNPGQERVGASQSLPWDGSDDRSLWREAERWPLACHNGKVGMDIAVDSDGRIAFLDPTTGLVWFYRLAPAEQVNR